jgi:prepilin-type N-terminal cleavage/methylation domain-containing protein
MSTCERQEKGDIMKTGVRIWKSRVRGGRRNAFTLIELLIVVVILGILAGIVIAGFSNTSLETKENMLKENLRIMRTQIGAYRAQHDDTSPGYPDGDESLDPTEQDFLDQMTLATDIYGDTTAANAIFGPYMRSWPANPLNNKSGILILADGDAVPAEAADGDFGWLFKPSQVVFKAYVVGADANGTSYIDY